MRNNLETAELSGICEIIWKMQNELSGDLLCLENAKQNVRKLTLSGKCVIIWKMRNKMSGNLLCLENAKENENLYHSEKCESIEKIPTYNLSFKFSEDLYVEQIL